MKLVYKVEDIIPKNGRQLREIHHSALGRKFVFTDDEIIIGEVIFMRFLTSEYGVAWMHTSLVQSINGQIGDDNIEVETLNTIYIFKKTGWLK